MVQNLISSHKDPGLSPPTAPVKVFLNRLAVKLEGEDLTRCSFSISLSLRLATGAEELNPNNIDLFLVICVPGDWNATS